jgi:tetratricopeptide (TPR) repeat protein
MNRLSRHPGAGRGLSWIPAFAGMTFLLLASPHAFAESNEDQKITRWLSDIDRSSEKGDFNVVQDLRGKLADYAAATGRYDLAARQYELLLASRPGRAERVKIFTKLGHMRMALKNYGQAISAYDDALHDSPKDWDANLARARAFFAADIDQRAIESYERCIKLRPQEAAPYDELAGVYEKQGFLGKALGFYEKALARTPKPEIYLHMADCYVHLHNLTMAVQTLSQAKARLPRADYDVRLGEIYQSLGDLARTSAAWEEALKADPKRDDVRLRLTLIYDRLHRREDADRLFRDLVASYPQSPVVHFMKALVLLDRGDKGAAQAEAQRVQQLEPTELVAHFNDLLISELRKRS